MEKYLKLFILNLIVLLVLGLKRTSAQISISISDARKINATYAKLDSAQAQCRLVLIDLKKYQDSTIYWKNKALKLKRKRNIWRTIAIAEATFIALTSRKK